MGNFGRKLQRSKEKEDGTFIFKKMHERFRNKGRRGARESKAMRNGKSGY